MRKLILVSLLFLGSVFHSQAQQEAVTRDGKVVILLDNGTWKYAEKLIQQAEELAPKAQKIAPDAPVSIKDNQLESMVFIEGPSPKLQKYFKVKNIVRAECTLSGKEGKAHLKINWKVQTSEAFSYFGYIKKGSSLSLELLNGETIELFFTEEVEPKEFTKYGFSTYQSNVVLTNEQVNLLQSGIIKKSTMNWGRRSEEYTIKNPAYFITELPKILK